MTFPKTKIIVKIEDNLMRETCMFSYIHFWDFLAETSKQEVKKVLGPPSIVAEKILGGGETE